MPAFFDKTPVIKPTDREYIKIKTTFRTDVTSEEPEVNSDILFEELCNEGRAKIIGNGEYKKYPLEALSPAIQQELRMLRVSARIMDLFTHPEHCSAYFTLLDKEIEKRVKEAGYVWEFDDSDYDEDYFTLFHLKWPLPNPDGSFQKLPKPRRLLSDILLELEQYDGINLTSPNYIDCYPVPTLLSFVPDEKVNELISKYSYIYKDDIAFNQQLFHSKDGHRIHRTLYSAAEKVGQINFEGLSQKEYLTILADYTLKKRSLWGVVKDFSVSENDGLPAMQSAYIVKNDDETQKHLRFSLGDPYVLHSYLINNKNFPYLRLLMRDSFFHGMQKIYWHLRRNGSLSIDTNLHDVIGFYIRMPENDNPLLDFNNNKNYRKYENINTLYIYPSTKLYSTSAILFKPKEKIISVNQTSPLLTSTKMGM